MAAALFRRGAASCVRCIHRELCRLIWRPQTALFSSEASDRKQPRRTHIKKAKPQPPLDVAKLLQQLFSQRRPGTAPPVGKARPAKASSMPTKPPTISSKVSTLNVHSLLKTEPAVSGFTAASSVPEKTTSTAPLSPQPKSVSSTNPNTSCSLETPQQYPHNIIEGFADSVSSVPPTSTAPASLGSEAAAIGGQTSTEAVEPNVETVTESVEHKTATVRPSSAVIVEPPIETTTELPVEPIMPITSPVETLDGRAALVEGPVEPKVDVPAEDIQTKCTDSGVVDILQTAKEEPLIETAIDASVEASTFHLETLQSRAADVEGPVEPMVDISHTATEEPPLETTVEPSVEASVQAIQTSSTDSGPANLSHIAEEESIIETAIDALVEASTSPLETLENRDAVAEGSVQPTIETEPDRAPQAVQTKGPDSGVVDTLQTANEEPLIESTVDSPIEARHFPLGTLEGRAADVEGPVEPTIDKETADNLSSSALVQDAQEYAPLPLKNKVESSSGNVAMVEAVNKTDELLQTKDALDEEAEKQLQELLVQAGTEAEYKAAAETGSSNEDESEALTKALSKWDSLSEDLQELEGESATLVTEHLCHVAAVLSKTCAIIRTSSTSDLDVVANGESMQMEGKGTEAEAMSLESITLAKVKAEVGGLEAEVLLETRNALEKEAEALAKQEKMDVKPTIEDTEVFEDTTEADILALDSISEATEAIEAETSIIMEAMFGSEQGPRQPSDTLLFIQTQDSMEQEAPLEAMTLGSVTLAEVEASLGTLENETLSETTDYLDKEAEILAEEKRMVVDDGVASEQMTEAQKIESLFLPEDDALSEALQTDTLMDELPLSIPGHVTGVTEDLIGQEVARVDIFKDIDPVQRLFLEKIREYDNMYRLNGGLLEAEPDYVKYLSEETAKLQRLYGGGDLSSFPEFTFTEPEMDQDSK